MLIALVGAVGIFVWALLGPELLEVFDSETNPTEPIGGGAAVRPTSRATSPTAANGFTTCLDGQYDDRTYAEECFGSDDEAREAGYRASEVR